MKDILVSIIIPVYNVQQYLSICLDSVISQTYQNIEIIVVDDGSPDNSGKICDDYKLKDNRINVIHQKNMGLSGARNTGIEHANGKYICFLDSDDFMEKNAIATFVAEAEGCNADVVISNFNHVDENGAFIDQTTLQNSELISGINVLKNNVQSSKDAAWVWMANKLYKREIFDNVKFELGKLHEDEFIFHRIFLQCKTVRVISASLLDYRIRNGSIMNSNWSIRRLDAVEGIFRRAIDFTKDKETLPLIIPTLKAGMYIYNLYYNKLQWKADSAHKTRNKELQELFNTALDNTPSKYIGKKNTILFQFDKISLFNTEKMKCSTKK